MKPKIDPKVDCVFKAILGHEEHKNLLIHFLNAVLQTGLGARIQEIEILNPYNEREFKSDKLSVVDVKARDDQGRSYQIEIQLALHPGLTARMLYTWSAIYHSLLRKGQVFSDLRPVIAIWLLNDSLFPAVHAAHLPFEALNREYGISLSDHFWIHILQLPEWHLPSEVCEELDRWMYLFKEGEELDVDQPPAILQTEEMKQAMQVLQHFSENEREYLLYQSRLEAELVENTWKAEIKRVTEEAAQAQREKEQAQREKEQAQREKEQERREKEQERREKEYFLELLKQAGIDPKRS